VKYVVLTTEKYGYFQSNTEYTGRCVGVAGLLVHVCCVINLKLFAEDLRRNGAGTSSHMCPSGGRLLDIP
jgi:hypothetical protein